MHSRLKPLVAMACSAVLLMAGAANAEKYVIDTENAHAFVQFRIKHLGYSWLYGRFNDFSGDFTYNEGEPNESRVAVVIKTASLDSNHAERDKHLRGSDFLNVGKYPEARFESTSYTETGIDRATLQGDLTLRGVTRPVTIDVRKIGSGPDPWGGYRRGFEGTTEIALKDFGIDYNLGPASTSLELTLSIEGLRQ